MRQAHRLAGVLAVGALACLLGACGADSPTGAPAGSPVSISAHSFPPLPTSGAEASRPPLPPGLLGTPGAPVVLNLPVAEGVTPPPSLPAALVAPGSQVVAGSEYDAITSVTFRVPGMTAAAAIAFYQAAISKVGGQAPETVVSRDGTTTMVALDDDHAALITTRADGDLDVGVIWRGQ